MGLRELLILLLGFAIVAVILRGLYVAMQARRGQIKLAIDKNIPQDVDLEALEMAELPGGGARVVSRGPAAGDSLRATAIDTAKQRAAAMDLGEDDDAIPVLMDSVAVADAQEFCQEHVETEADDLDDYETGLYDEEAYEDNEVEDDFDDERDVQLGSEDWEDPDDVLLDYGDRPSAPKSAPTMINSDPDSVRPHDRDEPAQDLFAEEQGELAFTDESLSDEDDAYSEDAYSLDDFARDEAEVPADLAHEEDDDTLPGSEQAASTSLDDDYEDYEDYEDGEDNFGTSLEVEEDEEDYAEEWRPTVAADASTYESGGTASEDYEEYDEYEEYDDELAEADLAESAPQAGERLEPGFDPNASLDDDPFSMTAGERIGYQEKTVPPARSLFSRFRGSEGKTRQAEKPGRVQAEAPAPAEEAPAKRSSLFAAIGRKVVEQSRERFRSREDERSEAESVERELPQEHQEPLLQDIEHYTDDAPNDPPASAPVEAEIRQPASSGQPTEIRQQSAATQPSEVIVLNVMAREGYVFHGEDLMPCLLTSGLKFGEMAIFHQRFGNDSRGPVIFSVANILNPGTFDLNNMANFTTVGVSMFLALPSPINNLEAFEMMLGTAKHLCATLDGELKDDHRNVMTAQTIEHYRQRIRDFELRQLRAAGSRG